MAMANRLIFSLPKRLFVMLCYVVATIAHTSSPHQTSHKMKQHSLSYNLRPQDFPNDRLYRAYLVIQRFKGTITSDPKNITGTWTGNDICGEKSYVGFYCATLMGRAKELTVTAVALNGFGLHAPKLQGFVDQLPDIALFHAASNNFGIGVPRLTGLAYSYDLSVDDDDIQAQDYSDVTGEATANVHCVTVTIHFRIHAGSKSNRGGGIIPGVTDGKALLLNYNNLSGPLPENLGFSKLSFLALANNKLIGPIPQSIGHLQDSLLELLLLNNQLSGCLPQELGMLHKATVIDAGMNQLTGPIPSSFSCLSSVEQLHLASNRLYGQVPDALCKLAGPAGRLANVTLSGNYFTSVGPACTALIKDGVMDVKNNCIPGLANQRRPAECAAFQSEPKNTCPAASTPVTCPAAAAMGAVAPGERKAAREYSSYVTYATLHE
ncbi:hypothetical protein HU200_014476 [Digitaria exilis]|uniref:Uncharacterized protein n=1 Tax=Digitaria exilis TaxID=1010633 RepID=A0A835FBJ0_9POAL|nr:hypothetical protein HU200_014476 [Digitaria exilis]